MRRRLHELRKWDLGPVGAAIFVGLILVARYAVVVSGGRGDSREHQIRAFYSSAQGGGAPPEQAKLIHVRDCKRVGPPGEYFILKCALEYHGQTFSSCFAFENDQLQPKSRERQTGPRCEKGAVWSRDANSLISR